MLKINAIISVGAEAATVISHRWPSSNVTSPNDINIKKTVISKIKKEVNPDDHLPKEDLGRN